MKGHLTGTLSLCLILFFLLKTYNCQEIANDTLEAPEQNVTETCPESQNVRNYLQDTTRSLYENEFLPAQTLTMKSYVDEKLGLIQTQFNAAVQQKDEEIRTLQQKVGQMEEENSGQIQKMNNLENELKVN